MVKNLIAPSLRKDEQKATKQDDGEVPDFLMPIDTGKKVKRPPEAAVEMTLHMFSDDSSLFQFEGAAKQVISAKYDRTRV